MLLNVKIEQKTSKNGVAYECATLTGEYLTSPVVIYDNLIVSKLRNAELNEVITKLKGGVK